MPVLHVSIMSMAENNLDSMFISSIDIEEPSDCSEDTSEHDLDTSGCELEESEEVYHGIIQGYMFEPIADPSPSQGNDSQETQETSQANQGLSDRTLLDPSEW